MQETQNKEASNFIPFKDTFRLCKMDEIQNFVNQRVSSLRSIGQDEWADSVSRMELLNGDEIAPNPELVVIGIPDWGPLLFETQELCEKLRTLPDDVDFMMVEEQEAPTIPELQDMIRQIKGIFPKDHAYDMAQNNQVLNAYTYLPNVVDYGASRLYFMLAVCCCDPVGDPYPPMTATHKGFLEYIIDRGLDTKAPPEGYDKLLELEVDLLFLEEVYQTLKKMKDDDFLKAAEERE